MKRVAELIYYLRKLALKTSQFFCHCRENIRQLKAFFSESNTKTVPPLLRLSVDDLSAWSGIENLRALFVQRKSEIYINTTANSTDRVSIHAKEKTSDISICFVRCKDQITYSKTLTFTLDPLDPTQVILSKAQISEQVRDEWRITATSDFFTARKTLVQYGNDEPACDGRLLYSQLPSGLEQSYKQFAQDICRQFKLIQALAENEGHLSAASSLTRTKQIAFKQRYNLAA